MAYITEGEVDIEELAKTQPEKIVTERFNVGKSFFEFQARNIGIAGGLKGKELMDVSAIIQRMVQLFLNCDATIGADGYAPDAGSAVEEIRKLIKDY